MSENKTRIELILYEPRFFGWARWERQEVSEVHYQFSIAGYIKPLDRGWWKPPRGWTYRVIDETPPPEPPPTKADPALKKYYYTP